MLDFVPRQHPPMAYNREWDQGKDNWGDGGWGYEGRNYGHGRDEDHYGDGKRRKFNNGVSLACVLHHSYL